MMLSTIHLLNVPVFVAAALLSYGLTFYCRRVAYRFNLLDYPEGETKTHKNPMPFLGGVAVFTSFWSIIFIGIGVARFYPEWIQRVEAADWFISGIRFLFPKIFGIFLGGFLILLVGLFDDKFRWKPAQKFAGQFIAVLVLTRLGLMINLLHGWGAFGYLVTFVWVLLIINAFNFIDSLDGHCAGVALISAASFFCITIVIHQSLVGIFLITFAGALIGFLPHNFRPAKIYLGDNGSLFIGYMMAAFTLLSTYKTPSATHATVFIPVLVFGVPLYDTLSVVIVRIWRGLPPWQGDRNHFAHRLVKLGMSDRVAVLFSYQISFTIGSLAVLMTQVYRRGAVLVGVIFFSMLFTIAFLEYYAARRIRLAEQMAGELKRRRDDQV